MTLPIRSTMLLTSPWLVAGSLGLGATSSLSAQVITGTVRQDHTGLPFSGVEVLLDEQPRRAVTDSAGRFVFKAVSRGTHVILVRSVGYRPIRYAVVVDADTVQADARLVSFAVRLDPIKVTAPTGSRLMGIDERIRLGIGLFVDSSELRRSDAVRLGDFLGRQGGIHLDRTRTGAYAMSLSQVGPYGERCPMSLVVDGTAIYRSSGLRMKGMPEPSVPLAPPPDLNAFLGVPDLQAVEIYRRPSEVPMEFGGRNTGCGVIVMWTRRAR